MLTREEANTPITQNGSWSRKTTCCMRPPFIYSFNPKRMLELYLKKFNNSNAYYQA